MGASDYMVGNAPQGASYAAPLAGIAFGQQLASLPDAYFQGTQQKRTRELQKPILDENGEPSTDVNKVTKELMRRGGAEYSKELIPFLQRQPFLDNALNRLRNGGGGSAYDEPGGQGPGTVYMPGPGMRGGATDVNPPGQRARVSSNGSDIGAGPGEDTLRSVATEFVGGDTDATPQISMAARALRINPDEPLTPEKAKLVKDFLGTARTASLGNQETQPPGQPSSAAERASNGPGGNAAAPIMAGGASGAPAPQTGPALGTRVAQGADQNPLQGLVPDSYLNRPGDWSTILRKRAEAISKTNEAMERGGLKSDSAEKQAEALNKKADAIDKFIGEAGARTGEQKNARDTTVTQSEGIKLAQKQELTRGDALQKGVQGAAREYETALKPHLDAMRGILNNPNFVSGSGVGFQEALNKIRSSPLFSGLPGYDPNAALPNEAIRKVVAASILNQTTELKAEAAEMGGSAGRLFQQQISLMEKAAQNPENTAPALRYLTELQSRMGDHARGIAELANNYQGKYGKGVLDNDFNEVLSKFNRDHPIFEQKEIADMRRFAPPPAPAFNSKEEATAWARKNNIPAGEPIKLPSGKIIPAP